MLHSRTMLDLQSYLPDGLGDLADMQRAVS